MVGDAGEVVRLDAAGPVGVDGEVTGVRGAVEVAGHGRVVLDEAQVRRDERPDAGTGGPGPAEGAEGCRVRLLQAVAVQGGRQAVEAAEVVVEAAEADAARPRDRLDGEPGLPGRGEHFQCRGQEAFDGGLATGLLCHGGV